MLLHMRVATFPLQPTEMQSKGEEINELSMLYLGNAILKSHVENGADDTQSKT